MLLAVSILKTRSAKHMVIDCEDKRRQEIIGKVDTAFFDLDINVKAFVVIFENGERYINPIYLKSLNGSVNKGDSIYKPAGRFTFYRHKDFKWIEIMNQDTLICSDLSKDVN
jgi:hypothetical protein